MTTSFIENAVEGIAGVATGRAAGAFATGTPLPDSPFSNRPVPSGFEQTPLPTFTQRPRPSTVTDSSTRVDFEDDGGRTGRSYTLTGQVVKGGPGYDYSMDISPIRGGPQFRRTVAGVKEPDFGISYLSYLVDQKMQGTQRYDPVTGTTKSDFPGALSMVLPSPLGAIAGLGQAISQANLERIAKNAYIGEDGFAVATLNGRTIGVSPSPFGGHVLSGVLPNELSPSQRQQITQKLLEISKTEDASGAYMGPDPTAPAGQTVAESESGAGQFTGDGDDYQQTPAPAYTAPPQITYTTDPGQDDPAPTTTSQDFSASSSPSSNQSSYEAEAYGDYGQYRADGGSIGFVGGGKVSKDPVQSTGFVDGPPQNYAKGTTVADTENHRVRVGSFVLNAPTTERLQKEGKLPKGPQKRKAAKGGKMMEVALSKGEYVIDADDVGKFGGYAALEKENDKGKPEVERRQAAAQGGFLGGYSNGGNITLPTPSPVRQAYVGEDIDRPEIPLTDNMIAQFKVYNSSKKQREDVENLINALNDRENLALTALAETTAENDSIEAMMGVQTTVLNRVKSTGVKLPKYPIVRRDFTKATDVKSALRQRTPGRGSGSFMFQYDGFEPKFLSPKIDSILKGQVPKFAITKIMASSANVLDPEAQFGEGLFPDTVTFYTREDAPLAKEMELNPQMRYVTTLGGHDFYSYEAAPESPDEEKIYKEYLDKKRKKKN